MSWLFVPGGQIIGTSASAPILLMNIQGWFHVGWTGLISLVPKGLSRIFSSTKVQIINSSVLSHFYYPALTSSSQILLKEVPWLFLPAWPVIHQASLSMGILQDRILEWVAMLSSRGSSQPRDRTQISHTASGFFTGWATRGKCLPYFLLAACDIWIVCVYICTYTYTSINIGPSNVDDCLVSFITLINKISVHTMWASLVAQMVKNLPAIWKIWVQSLGWEGPWEKGMATHSSILAWKIHRQRTLAGHSPLGSQRVIHDWATNTFTWVIHATFYTIFLTLHFFLKSNWGS